MTATPLPAPDECPVCQVRLDSVHGGPDPRTARLTWTGRPCGHPLGGEQAMHAGVPGLIVPVNGATLIAAERDLVLARGRTVEHDLRFTGNQLAWRAWCLIDDAATSNPTGQPPPMWAMAGGGPWPAHKRAMGKLIDAGQYVAAEIDRLGAEGERP